MKIEGMGQMRHCQHQSGYRWHWQHRGGAGSTYGGTAGTGGSGRARGAGLSLEKKEG